MQMETKKCKYCQMDIPKKAKVCPNCKRTLNSHGCLISVLVGLIVLCLTIAAGISMSKTLQRSASHTSNDAEYITMEEYDKIESGMSYEEVRDIIGSDGELTSTSSVGEYKVDIYTWYGDGAVGANANVTFENGSVVGKAQVGLR